MPLFGRDQELRDIYALIAKAEEGGGALARSRSASSRRSFAYGDIAAF